MVMIPMANRCYETDVRTRGDITTDKRADRSDGCNADMSDGSPRAGMRIGVNVTDIKEKIGDGSVWYAPPGRWHREGCLYWCN